MACPSQLMPPSRIAPSIVISRDGESGMPSMEHWTGGAEGGAEDGAAGWCGAEGGVEGGVEGGAVWVVCCAGGSGATREPLGRYSAATQGQLLNLEILEMLKS